jgi:hypothetical protein
MQLSPVSRHFISLRTRYSPQHPVHKHPQSVFIPYVRDLALHIDRNICRILALFLADHANSLTAPSPQVPAYRRLSHGSYLRAFVNECPSTYKLGIPTLRLHHVLRQGVIKEWIGHDPVTRNAEGPNTREGQRAGIRAVVKQMTVTPTQPW